MSPHSISKQLIAVLSLCLALAPAAPSQGKSHRNRNNVSQTAASQAVTAEQGNPDAGGSTYTVKSGDTLYKILMREYGLTGRQADRFVRIVRRENNISNIRRLKIGQKISITAPRRAAPPGLSSAARSGRFNNRKSGSTLRTIEPVQMFSLQRPAAPFMDAAEVTAGVQQVWGKINPGQQASKKPLTVNSGRISLSFDPQNYPILSAMDGSQILLDANSKLSPAVRTIVSETAPDLRIVSESPENPKRFLGALLEAGKFYSVEENFKMEFGDDPKLIVHSDFRVERSADSVVNQDVVLLNAGRSAFPYRLTQFLKKEGFTVYEPFILFKQDMFAPRNRLVQISSQAPLDIASSMLKALSIPFEKNTRLDIIDVENSGVSISITPDRTFRHKGKIYCITYVKDSAAHNALDSVLKTKGINPIHIGPGDGFREISAKILSSIGVSGNYAFHTLWPEEGAGYSLKMSGIMIDNAGVSGESLFLTDREISRIIRDISSEYGLVVRN